MRRQTPRPYPLPPQPKTKYPTGGTTKQAKSSHHPRTRPSAKPRYLRPPHVREARQVYYCNTCVIPYLVNVGGEIQPRGVGVAHDHLLEGRQQQVLVLHRLLERVQDAGQVPVDSTPKEMNACMPVKAGTAAATTAGSGGDGGGGGGGGDKRCRRQFFVAFFVATTSLAMRYK